MNIPVKRNGQWVYAALGLVKEIGDEVLVLAVKDQEMTVPASKATIKIVKNMMQIQDFVLLPIVLDTKTLLMDDIEVSDKWIEEWQEVEISPLI